LRPGFYDADEGDGGIREEERVRPVVRAERAMKRLVPIAAASIALGAAGFALAGGVAVTLGPSGPQPRVVTVSWGDTLSFANGDSVAHAITSPREDLRSPAIPPGGTYSSVITARTGTYPYKQTGGKSLPGFLIVRTGGTVSLTAQPRSVLYGRSVTLAGVSSIPSTPVLIEQHLRGARDWTQITTVTSAPDGRFSAVAGLPIGANVRASVASGQVHSEVVHVRVRPRLTIASQARRTVADRRIDVLAGITPANASTRIYLLSCSVRSGVWKRAGSKRPGPGGGATFKWKAQAGRTLLRVAVKNDDLVKGYSPSASTVISVTAKGALPGLARHRKHRYC
jgi:plastocyanin